MFILNFPDDRLLAPYSSPNGRFLIFAGDLLRGNYSEKNAGIAEKDVMIEKTRTHAIATP